METAPLAPANDRVTRFALAAVIMVAIGIRLWYINQPMRLDEARTFLEYALSSFGTTISYYPEPNNHVFHSVLVWVSLRLFGEAQWAIRLPALIAGILMVPATFHVGLKLSNARAGLLAASLVAVWPKLILFSTNARGYTLVCLAFLILLYLVTRLLERERREYWIVFALVVFLGMYTIPTMLYPAAGAFAWLIVEKARRSGLVGLREIAPRLVGCLMLAAALTVLAYVPVIRASGLSALVGNKYVVALSAREFLRALLAFPNTLRHELGYGVPNAVQLVLAGCIVIALVAREGRAPRLTLVVSVAGSCLVLLALSRRVPPTRVLLYTVPLLCVFAGIGLDTVVAKLSARASSLALASSAAALVLPLGLGWFTIASGSVIRDGETVVFHNAREIADFLRTRMVHDERLVMARAGSVYDYYLRQSGHRLREYMGPQRTGALLVVVGNVSPHTPDQDPTYVIAHRPQIQASAYGPPVLIRKFPEIDIFEMPSLIQPTR